MLKSAPHGTPAAAKCKRTFDLCNQGKNFDVMESMYAPNIVSVEGDGKEWTGKGPVIQKSCDWGKTVTFHGEPVLGPYFRSPAPSDTDSGRFAVHFTLDITRNATGERVKLEEVALYTVKDGQIAREEFFYEGPH